MNSATFDNRTAAQLRKAQEHAAMELEYKDVPFNELVSRRYEMARSVEEAQRHKDYLTSLIEAYLVNVGAFKMDVDDTYRVSMRVQGRDTLSAEKLFDLGVDSATIEKARIHSEYTVVEVRKI